MLVGEVTLSSSVRYGDLEDGEREHGVDAVADTRRVVSEKLLWVSRGRLISTQGPSLSLDQVQRVEGFCESVGRWIEEQASLNKHLEAMLSGRA